MLEENKIPDIEEAVAANNIQVFFTEDKDLLDQYYDMRSESYRDEWGFDQFDVKDNKFDSLGKIAVAVKDGKVIGGMRLMFSDECLFLSNEVPGTQYNYKNVVSKYDKRDDLIISEISAIIVAKGNRDSTIVIALFDLLFKESKAHGCHYVCGVSVLSACRSERRSLRRINYDLEIVITFPWQRKKLYNFMKMFPIYVKIK